MKRSLVTDCCVHLLRQEKFRRLRRIKELQLETLFIARDRQDRRNIDGEAKFDVSSLVVRTFVIV